MPYLRADQKLRLDAKHNYPIPQTPGELNYLITRAIQEYLGLYTPSYEKLNSAIGALECAKMELYRRMVAPYEDKKIKENGDVYPHE
jgi:hypothetical protein